jgi:integration host factor subunit beta
VTLTEIVREITEKHDLPNHFVDKIIRNIFKNMITCLGNGGRAEIRGFGIFSLRYRAARTARNPKTGENLVTTSKYTVHFKPGRELRERVNQSAIASAD